jgi:hypothetical protein
MSHYPVRFSKSVASNIASYEVSVPEADVSETLVPSHFRFRATSTCHTVWLDNGVLAAATHDVAALLL